jgi:hypothetical protein
MKNFIFLVGLFCLVGCTTSKPTTSCCNHSKPTVAKTCTKSDTTACTKTATKCCK